MGLSGWRAETHDCRCCNPVAYDRAHAHQRAARSRNLTFACYPFGTEKY